MLAFLLAAAATLGMADALPPPDPVPVGVPIVTITVLRHDVFDLADPATRTWPYRWANSLHFLTRETLIRRLLLFSVGDPLDYNVLAESERILRQRGFLNPVDITVRPATDGAEVVVETHDQWTTEAGFTVGILGSHSRSGFNLSEDNLLGYGKKLDLDVKSEPERTTTTVTYKDPVFLGSRWRFEIAHSDTSDGSGDELKVEYPFFSLATARAVGFEWERKRLDQWLWSGGEKAVSGTTSTEHARVWGGFRLSSRAGHTDRLTVAGFAERTTFGPWAHTDGQPYARPSGLDLAGIAVGWERQTESWRVVRGFRGWQRQEDVSLGPNWNASLGLSLPALGADRRRLLFAAGLSAATLRGQLYSWVNTSCSGRVDSGVSNALLHIDAGTAHTGANGLRAKLSLDLGRELDLNRQLTLGADAGLRGWDPGTFDGTSRVVVNLEWRYRFSKEVLHLAVLGVTAFADTGKSWAPRVGSSTDGWRADAGIGLLVELTRASLVRVVRLEVAFPDDGRGPTFLATGVSLF